MISLLAVGGHARRVTTCRDARSCVRCRTEGLEGSELSEWIGAIGVDRRETTACGRTNHSPQSEGLRPERLGGAGATRSKRPPHCGRSDWSCNYKLRLVRPTAMIRRTSCEVLSIRVIGGIRVDRSDRCTSASRATSSTSGTSESS